MKYRGKTLTLGGWRRHKKYLDVNKNKTNNFIHTKARVRL